MDSYPLSDCTIYINPLQSSKIVNREKAETIQIYPNPTRDKLFIYTIEEIIEYTLYTSQGISVSLDNQIKTFPNNSEITTKHLSEGIYYLKLETKNPFKLKK